MIALVPLLLLAATTRLDLVDEVYRIPADEWRYVELELKQRAAYAAADYEVMAGPQGVRLVLMRARDLAQFRARLPFDYMAATAPGSEGKLRYLMRPPDDYVIVVDNRGGTRPADVRLWVSLDFSGRPGPVVTELSPRRQMLVILVSFALFFGIVGYSAPRLLGAIRR